MLEGILNFFNGADSLAVSHFLGKFLGLYLIIFGIFFLFRHDHVKRAVAEVEEKTSLQITWSFLPIIMGLLIVLGHQVWTWDWQVIITIVGWIFLLVGLIRLFFAEHAFKWAHKFLASPASFLIGAAWLVVGLILAWYGFYHA